MSKQTAIANINNLILQEREQGANKNKHSSLDTINTLLEEERQQKEERRRQQQETLNATSAGEVMDLVRSYDNSTRERRLAETPQPVKEERRTGNIWQQAISEATPKATQPENSRQNQRRSYTSPTTERTKENRRLYGMDTTLPEGRYSQITIPETNTNRRTVADIYNDTATMTRWRELASKDQLTAAEKQEARAARKEIKSTLGFSPSDVEGQGWKTRYSSDELPMVEELFGLDTSLNNRTNAGASIMAGVVHALGIDWLSDRIFDAAGIRGEDGSASPMKSTTTAIQKAQPGAFTVGNIAGSTGELLAISGAVGNAMKGVKWFTEAAPWIQKAISSGINFAINGLQSGITSTQTKEEWDEQERQNAALAAEFGAEYTPREYNPWKQVANVGISTGVGALAGAAGGALETVFGIGTSKALIRYGLQYNTIFRAIASGINGIGFATGSTAIQEASKYLQYPEGYTASPSEIASNLAVAFLFSSVSSVISDLKAAPQNRENLLKMMDELTREYAEVEMKMAGQTGQARRETAQRVTELTARIRNSVATSRGMSGVSNEIKSLVAALDIIDDRMAPVIAGGNGLLGTGDIMAQAEAAGFNPNTTLRLPAWDGTPSQPTNLEQAVQIVGANVPAPMGETVTLPEAPVQANNLPAWYAAYQNTTRPIDQPMQQRPNIPAPAAATPPLPQQSTQGNAATPPTPPVPQNAAQRPTEQNKVPETPAPLTPSEDRGTMETAKYETDAGRELANGLMSYNRLEKDGFEYTLNETSAGWIGRLHDVRGNKFGGMISDDRALDYQTQALGSREEAVDTLVQVAERNRLLGENPGPVAKMSPEEETRLRAEEATRNNPPLPQQAEDTVAHPADETSVSTESTVASDDSAKLSNTPVTLEGSTDKDIAAQNGISNRLWSYTRGSKEPVHGTDLSSKTAYLGNGQALVEVPDTAESVAMQDRKYGGIGAQSRDLTGLIGKAKKVVETGEVISVQPVALDGDFYGGQTGKNKITYVFTTPNGDHKTVGRDQIGLITAGFDGKLYYNENSNLLVAVNDEGTIHGVALFKNYTLPNGWEDKSRPAKLKNISSDTTLKLPTTEEAPAKAEAPLKLKIKEESDDGGNNGGMDSGRPNIRGGKPGPGGPSEIGAESKTGGSVSGNSTLRAGNVQPDEGNAGQPGARIGRPNDSVRSEQGSNAGHAGAADGQAVSGVAGEDAGSTEPGLSLGADDRSGRVTKSKPRNRKNYRITEDIDTIRPNYQDNIDAIKVLKDLMETGRKATPEEMAILAKYKGWGALKDILNEYSYWGRTLSKLLTTEEYNAAKLSTANAHYTSTKVINAMYDAVKRLGFIGGRVLEPSMGVGNFFGVMPDKLSKASDLYGVELDSITGNIAKLLYPDAEINVAGFQDVLFADDTFDLVIGNVPFSNEVKIPYRGTTYNLHDFFFVKALDETKSGGIAALITSTGTLDKNETKVRREIAARANLIAAFRLPDDAFKTNAGTSVTTDLIFLQKKGNGIDDNGIAFETIGKLNDIPINEYYEQHPKNILGNLAYEKGMYPGERAVVHSNGEDMQQALSNAIKTLPKDIMNTSGEAAKPVTMRKRGERKKAAFVVHEDGSVAITDSNTGEVIEYGKATKKERESAETIRDYVSLKNTFLDLLDTEARGENGTALREKLNTQYDSFVKKHGPLSDPSNKKLLKPDGDYIRTTGIEVKTKDGYGKSDIFRVPTVSKLPKTHANSAEEALSITLNESGKVDIPRMAELTGKTQGEIKDELKDEIIQTPDGDWQLVAQYASGNIYEKLDRIGDKPEYDRHRRLLEEALPRPKGADEIDASFGAHWIAPEYVKQFIDSTFFVNAKVQYNKELGQWTVEFRGWPSVKRFNTDRIDAKKIIESTLNGKNVVVKDKVDDKSVINEPETKLAQSKQDELREAFREWAFKDSKRAEDLISTFNRSLNAYAPMNYEALANRIDFGVNPNSTKQPRDYQKAAAARIVFGGNTLLHNGVGTGKTLTMAIAAHALKQAGIANKPMFVVPNGKVEDFRSEILEAYPDAKILAIDNDSMTPKQIQATKSLIATGDWDYVIVYRSAFVLIPLSPERAADALQRQLNLYESAARDIAGDKNGNKRFEKGLAQRVETLRNRIQELLDKPKDASTYFDDMGIDALFIDEAHNYKKVGFPTSMQVSGIVSDTNEITTDLYMKEEYLRDRGDRIVLASATPITNAISEMYNMTMHVAPEVYRNAGIYSFDAWANTFANIESQVEIAPDGKTFRRKERVRSYKNANELFGLYRQFADIKQTKDVVENLPEAEEITVICESDDLHKQIVDYLSDMPADRILQMNNDNRAAATDLRLVTELLKEMGLDPDSMDLDLPGSKINKTVNNIVKEYRKSQDVRGTQFVFLDIGINSDGKRYHFNLYDDMINKLVNAGIPRNEIAKIGDYNDEESRQVLYNKMNNGDIRVLIGSTAKMGEGVNAQKRAVALHDVSVPWRPDNLEQRHGRIVRSGNINKNVRIYRYVQEGSYDSYLWQMIERKAAYLSEAYNGGDATDMDELNDAMVSYRESKAIATGNPLIMEKMSLQDKISRLKILQRGWQKEKLDAQKTIDNYLVWKRGSEGEMKSAKADMETYKAEKEKAGNDLKITIGKNTYDNRKDATDALTPILEKKKVGPIGTLYGFTFGLTYDPEKNKYSLYARKQGQYFNDLGDNPAGNLTRIFNLVENAPKNAYESAKRVVDYYNNGIEDAKNTLESPFKHQKELEESQARMRVIDAELGVSGNEEEVVGTAESVSDSRDTANFNGNNAPRHPENWKTERVGDKDKTPMSLTDIVNMIRHDFDIPVTTGNIRSPDARAQYRRQPQSVRSKIANSIPDIAHELGHHLDNIYDIRRNISQAAKQEIIDAMPESFKAAYKKEQLPGEGIAEFLRRYLQNSETAVMDYPKFSDELFKMLDSKARATLDKLADEVNAYYALSEQEGNWPVHNREDKGRDYRGLGEKLKDMNTHFRTLFIDSLEPIKQFDDESGGNAYLFATNAAYAGNRAYAAITGDLYDLRGNKLGVGLQKALEGIHLNNKKEYTDFGMYLICRHGPERLAEGMRVFADDAWDNTAWMEQTADELSEKYPAFEEAAERLEEYQHELIEAYGVASGLYSQETIDAWLERWEHYVPFLRWMGDKTGRTKGQKQGFANQTGPFRKARGSGLEIINPVDNIMENTVRLITTSIRNEVMQKITEAASHMEGSGRWLEQVPMPLARKTWDGKGLKNKTLDEFDEYFKAKGKDLGEKGLDLIQQILDNAIDDLLVQYGRGKAHGDIVTVMKNGNPQYWKINDPDLLRSVTTMGPTRAGELLNYYGRVTRFVTGNITGMNIVWSIASNLPRDIGTMFTFSKTKNIAKLLAGIGESYVNRIKGDKANELYKEYMAMGGNSTSAQTADKDMAKKARKALQKQKTDWLNPLEWVEFVSDMIEAGPRYSYYKICRTKYGMTPEEAFYAAMEITVNFKKAGVLSREVNILVPFFNAGIQGVDRAARWLAADDLPKEERKEGRTRRIGVYLGASLAIAALSMGLNLATKRKRDNLEKLSTYTKNNYFIVPTKNGKYVAIPKPRELAIPISLFERIMEYYIGHNPHALDDFWEYATDNTLPGVISGVAQGDLNSAIGDLGVLGTFHYLTSNQDFLGRPIVSDSLAKMEPKDQYDQNTSQLAKMIGQAFNLSPKQMDFLGNNLFGGFWQWQKALAPVSGKSDITLGVQSKWIKDPLYSTDITNRMYDQRDKLERLKNSNPDNMEIAAQYRTISDLSSFYGRYYRLAKNEEETPQNRMIREAMLDTILGVEQNAEVEPARKFLLDVVERERSTELMPAVMDVTVTGDDKTTYNLTSEEYFMHQTRYEALYYNYIRQAMDNQPKMTDEEKTSTVEAAKKIAGIVARGEAVEDHGGTYKSYTKVKDLLDDGVSEGELINYLSAKDNADLDGNSKVSNAELLHATWKLKIPTDKAASLIDYSESNSNLGLKLRTVDDYGIDTNEYALVLDALGDRSVSQEHVQDAIDEVYGPTTAKNQQEKAAMWQALGPTGKTAWKSSKNPYDTEVSEKVRNGLTLPKD